MPSAKAISVAAGIAHPRNASALPKLKATYSSAGTAMPPTAPIETTSVLKAAIEALVSDALRRREPGGSLAGEPRPVIDDHRTIPQIQADALAALAHAAEPEPFVVNVAGPATHRVADLEEALGARDRDQRAQRRAQLVVGRVRRRLRRGPRLLDGIHGQITARLAGERGGRRRRRSHAGRRPSSRAGGR